jgi:hypothetical protein
MLITKSSGTDKYSQDNLEAPVNHQSLLPSALGQLDESQTSGYRPKAFPGEEDNNPPSIASQGI